MKINEQELNDKEDEVKGITYDPVTYVDSVFNKIKAFQDLCILTSKDKSDSQLVSLDYLIFTK